MRRCSNAGGISLSELMVGGPVDPSEMRPTVGHTVSFGNLQAYLEAYGASVKGLKVRYEIAATRRRRRAPGGRRAAARRRRRARHLQLAFFRSASCRPAITCCAPC